MYVWLNGTHLGVRVDGWNMQRCVWINSTCLDVRVDGWKMSEYVCR